MLFGKLYGLPSSIMGACVAPSLKACSPRTSISCVRLGFVPFSKAGWSLPLPLAVLAG